MTSFQNEHLFRTTLSVDVDVMKMTVAYNCINKKKVM